MITRMLEKMGETVQARGMIYKEVSQSVLMYVSESLAVMGSMLNVLDGFHHRLSMRITGMTETCGAGRDWQYPLVVEALEDVALHPIMDYIKRRQAIIAGKVPCRPIYELCVKAEQMLGKSRMVRWWDQDVVNEPEE